MQHHFLAAHDNFTIEPAEQFIPADVVVDGRMKIRPSQYGTDGAFAARLRRNG